jgi:integrase
MAYVFREYRSNGKPWCIAYKGLDGRLRREKTDAPTKELAKRLLAKKLVELTEAKVSGVEFEPKVVTFNEFAKEYMEHARAVKTASAALRDESSLTHLKPFFGEYPLRKIHSGLVQRYIDQRMTKKEDGSRIRPATVNREQTTLSAMFREAVKRRLTDKNPVRGIRQLPENNTVVRYLTDDEEIELFKELSEHLKPIVTTALNTGMRKSELLGLRWEEVDLEQRLICIKNAKNHKKRYIPINDVVLEVMNEQRRHDKDAEHVFPSRRSKNHWKNVDGAWQRAVRRAKIVNFRFHDLRHTFASRLIRKGVPIKAVQELLGHGSIVVTMRYAHLAPGDLREAVDLLGGRKAPAARREGLGTEQNQ